MTRGVVMMLTLLALAPSWAGGPLAGGFGHRAWVDGQGLAWVQGANLRGQLGNGGVDYRDTPQHPLGMADIVQIASGLDHMLALQQDGTLWGWGYGDVGQVGGTFQTIQILDSLGLPFVAGYSSERQPIRVHVPPFAQQDIPLVEIAAGGRHSLALARDGSLWAWGRNRDGQLGLGDPLDRYLPSRLRPLPDIVRLAAGGNHSLALDGNGTLYAWGANDAGQLGDGTQQQRSTPGAVQGLPPIATMAGGAGFTVAVDRNGQLWSWGANESGQLGDGTITPHSQSIAIPRAIGVKAVAAGRAHALALRYDGSVWAWGAGELGQLGQGDTQQRLVPQQVQGLPKILAIACGDGFSMAQGADGVLYAWGDNRYMQLGSTKETGSLWLLPRATTAGKWPQ